uniref:Ribonuclease H-like domain-containing protein n=1 Tax=Tanacetum cinerariifolium TaxID=118510 RepID=A0A699GWV4_TANCI|nr:ribonuclease H-like domain-containing protein [Tanacetum cinerariifolium]
MDIESAQNNVVAKLPLLKQGDYEMWKLRIEQYFQIQDYALWDVIENVNSFNPVPRITANVDVNTTMPRLCLKPYKQDLMKIVSQLAILGENISQEDLNMKFLRSLPVEWNTHVVVWRNKVDLDTMSIDDLYNNFKIVEQEVKRTVVSSSSSESPNMAFLSSPSSNNEVDTTSIQVSDASTPVSTVSSLDNTANLNDATVYAFLAKPTNGSQLVHEDLEQIHKDDLEEMDLKWKLALLSMRARRLRDDDLVYWLILKGEEAAGIHMMMSTAWYKDANWFMMGYVMKILKFKDSVYSHILLINDAVKT